MKTSTQKKPLKKQRKKKWEFQKLNSSELFTKWNWENLYLWNNGKFLDIFLSFICIIKVCVWSKAIQKYINHKTHPLSSADIIILHQKLAFFLHGKKIKVPFWYRICDSFDSYWVFQGFLIKVARNFDDARKTDTTRFPLYNCILKQ